MQTKKEKIMSKVYILLAPGFEIIEATAPIDVLTRCGIEVEKVAVLDNNTEEGLLVASSHSVQIKADSTLTTDDDVQKIIDTGDMVILPGGFPGYENLATNKLVGKILEGYSKAGKFIAAICGAPTALAAFDIDRGSRITCHSSVKDRVTKDLNKNKTYIYTGNAVETDGKLITGKGAGVCMEFAFACAAALTDSSLIAETKKKMEI